MMHILKRPVETVGECARLCAVGLIAMAALLFPPERAAAQAVTTMGIEAAETYVHYYLADGYLHIREYFVSSTESEETRPAQAAKVAELIAEAQFSKARFGLQNFTAIEERIFLADGYMIAEYHLLTKETNAIASVTSIFRSLFGRTVKVSIREGEIGLYFNGPDISIRDNNARGLYGKDDKRAVIWPKGVGDLEMVFGSTEKDADQFVSLAPYFSRDIASHEWSKEEIAEWRQSGKRPAHLP